MKNFINYNYLTLISLFIFYFNADALANSLLIKNINLIDGTGSPISKSLNVFIEDGKFKTITSSHIDVNKETISIDGTNKYLIPGIIDNHIHLPGGRTGPGNRKMVLDFQVGREILESYLYSGVTTVYDSNNNPEYIYRLREDERNGRILSPRIFATLSLIAPPNGHGCCAGGMPVDNFSFGIPKSFVNNSHA